MTKELLRRRDSIRPTLSWRLIGLALFVLISSQTARALNYAAYFTFQDVANFPANPSSILLHSSIVDVPAGAVLKVHLMRGEQLVSTSSLTFAQAFRSELIFPPVTVATFLPSDDPSPTGQPLPNTTLAAGKTDLSAVAQAPLQYRFLWELSAGLINMPGQAVVTGSQDMFVVRFLGLKGSAVSAASRLSDQKPGSVLFFNRFTSNASNPLREDTQINLTNTNPASITFVRLFFISGSTCEVTALTLCLAAQQTLGVLMSDLDPGVKGYVVAVAVDSAGRPTQFNWLIGQALLRQPATTGTVNSTLVAYTVAKRKEGSLTPDGNNQAELIFDDENYDRLPAQLAFDSVPSQLNSANTTQLSLYRPLANLAGGSVNTSVQVTAFGRGEQGQVISSSGAISLACFAEYNVGSLRLAPVAINNLILPGATGWLAVSTNDLLPLLGTQINVGGFSSGANARALSFSTEYRIKMPVTTLTCPQ